MKNKTAWLSWTLCSVVVLGALFSFALTWNDPKMRVDVFTLVNGLISALLPIAFGVVGALILSRLPRHRIGWLLMVIALAIAVIGSLQGYYIPATNSSAERTVITFLIIWASGWSWWLLIGPLLFILLTFPTGQLLSPRWRWVVGMIALLFVIFLVFVTVSPEWQDPTTGLTLPNPLGSNTIPADFTFETIQLPWTLGLVSTVALCVLSVFVRYRRSSQVEREQLKWFLSACAIFIAEYAVTGLLFINQEPPAWNGIIFNAILAFLPVSIGIAILRYHLYDIDLIIRRTLIYSILTALLALFYFGSVAVLQNVLSAVSGQRSEIAIIVSTLAIAALFNPLRHRVQDAIDQRFYRRKYDAQKVIERFATTVRDEVELEKLTGELLNVVNETMQPTSVSLWLKTTDGGRRTTKEGS